MKASNLIALALLSTFCHASNFEAESTSGGVPYLKSAHSRYTN
jgi:hypothetical protein